MYKDNIQSSSHSPTKPTNQNQFQNRKNNIVFNIYLKYSITFE